jgi:hypothetical protein
VHRHAHSGARCGRGSRRRDRAIGSVSATSRTCPHCPPAANPPVYSPSSHLLVGHPSRLHSVRRLVPNPLFIGRCFGTYPQIDLKRIDAPRMH